MFYYIVYLFVILFNLLLVSVHFLNHYLFRLTYLFLLNDYFMTIKRT